MVARQRRKGKRKEGRKEEGGRKEGRKREGGKRGLNGSMRRSSTLLPALHLQFPPFLTLYSFHCGVSTLLPTGNSFTTLKCFPNPPFSALSLSPWLLQLAYQGDLISYNCLGHSLTHRPTNRHRRSYIELVLSLAAGSRYLFLPFFSFFAFFGNLLLFNSLCEAGSVQVRSTRDSIYCCW